MTTTMMVRSALVLALAATLVPAAASAQQPTRRRQPVVEIRGQVPTPQVVTVRPREMPAYSRQVISPNFYDRNFWPTILPGYSLVPQRMITGHAPVDSTLLRADSSGTTGTTGTAGTPPQGMTVAPPPGRATPNLRTTTPARGARPGTSTTPGTTPRTTPDTTRGAAGTPPAPALR